MAALRRTTLLLASVAAGALGSAQKPRPNLTEWKDRQAAAKAEKEAAGAKQSKMGAVDKVVELLVSLQKKVAAEGEAEAKTYEKFACFCKDTTKEKVEAITKGEDSQAALSATIAELTSQRDAHDKAIQDAEETIADLEKDQKEADEARAATRKEYDANAKDLQAALDALEGAIKTLKASKKPSFAQLSGVSSLSTALGLADVLGLPGDAARSRIAALLQQPANEVQMQDYDFHSDGIVGTLEKLLVDFRKTKVDVDKAEVESVAQYDKLTQANTHELKMQKERMEKEKKAREDAIADIQANSMELSSVEATLLEDKAYTNKLSQMCSNKARTWDQRSALRADELATLTQAIGIIKGAVSEKTGAATIRFAQQGVSVRLASAVAMSPGAMEAIEAAAEAADAPALVQVGQHRSPAEEGRQAVIDLLMSKGKSMKSTLLASFATKLAADPLAKVKVLIQELIERLLQEAANEATQKGWCDKAMSDAKQKRDYASEEIATLNEKMAELEARRDSLTEALDTLEKEIAELTESQAKTKAEREEEKKENEETVKEASAGLDALTMCIDILNKFYASAKKESVDLSLAQASPEDEAPDAGFDNGEAYLGAQAESGGILGMLDVMKSDFIRTIEETKAAEAQAEKDFMAFMTETGVSLAEKEEAQSQNKAQKEDAVEKLEEAEASLDEQSGVLRSSLKELMELKPACIDTGMSYEDRVAMREDEIAALKKALCVLGNYAEYGPDAAAGNC